MSASQLAGMGAMTSQAELLLRRIDHLDIEKVDLVGNDSGEGVCQILAANHPEPVRPTPCPPPWGSWRIPRWCVPRPPPQSCGEPPIPSSGSSGPTGWVESFQGALLNEAAK
ncbi:MAG: pimeloyl-ACP methyl ester carboxylesterase [Candidatus Poriferisodalaceae bacterium]|jgi:pimeloyl-ACP methyl ester carboxylesterase